MKNILPHISGSWPARVRLVHSCAECTEPFSQAGSRIAIFEKERRIDAPTRAHTHIHTRVHTHTHAHTYTHTHTHTYTDQPRSASKNSAEQWTAPFSPVGSRIAIFFIASPCTEKRGCRSPSLQTCVQNGNSYLHRRDWVCSSVGC